MSEVFDIVHSPLRATAFGGAERPVLDLAVRFAARGNRVLMAGPDFGLGKYTWTQKAGELESLILRAAQLRRGRTHADS